MTISPLKSSPSLVEQVCSRLARQLRDEVEAGDGRLPPERQMAERLGVSRTVLREATKRLELQGLLEIRHGSGIRAVNRLHKPLSGSLSILLPELPERLRQLIEARSAIEPEIARQAALKARAADVKQLRSIHERLLAAESHDEAVEADIDFHRTLARIAGNEILKLMLESLADLGRESRRVTIGNVGRQRAIDHHAAILNAVAAHDAAAAAEAMKHHMDEAARDLGNKAKGKR
ncbi:FadR/GntR family transcriptional regulator [Prosthecobacter sp.]|uniref:FadR/GntR family transcriptional regulator n=1 Tax=Prosthecobacter sp. TaxID=1965333 RepID=UPI003783639F